jgi:hypothetical protein
MNTVLPRLERETRRMRHRFLAVTAVLVPIAFALSVACGSESEEEPACCQGGGGGSGGASNGGGGASGSSGAGLGAAGGSLSDGSAGAPDGSCSSCDGGFGYCPSVSPVSNPCRSDAECGGKKCFPPIESYCEGAAGGCGQCTPNEVCQGPDSCFLYRHCVPKCTSTSCPAGYSCGSDGLCARSDCSQAPACGTNQACVVGKTIENDCEQRKCAADADCDCGTCVNGECHKAPGQCG